METTHYKICSSEFERINNKNISYTYKGIIKKLIQKHKNKIFNNTYKFSNNNKEKEINYNYE